VRRAHHERDHGCEREDRTEQGGHDRIISHYHR
jgi:hypothetical protein